METIIKDGRTINAVLRKMAKENDFDFNNVYFNQWYKYIQSIDIHKKDADYCQTDYKNNIYKVKYFSGCFNPYLVKINNF
jgi:hypothetical protein